MIEILFFVGFVVLILGANMLVEGAASLGQRLKIPSIVIGMTIVAFGTSLPELVISGYAAFKGDTDLSIANVLGSNLLNILIILGISAIITPIPAKKNTVQRVIPASLAITILLFLIMYLVNGDTMAIVRWEGIIFLVMFILYLRYNKKAAKKFTGVDDMPGSTQFTTTKSVLYILIGLVALFISGKWIVDGANVMATRMGISQSVIGLTLVALATSLPELVTSVIAAIKKNTDIAIGNVIGSNIFNILLVLGFSSVVRPLAVYPELISDILMLIGSTILLYLFLIFNKKRTLTRGEGVLLVLTYAAYIIIRL